MREPQREFWFPAKRYGWGWGPPVTWQGWLVVAGFVLLSVGGVGVFLSQPQTPHTVAGLLVYLLLLSIGMTVICRIKGEPTTWRWGK